MTLEELFDNWFKKFRAMAIDGISAYSDKEVGDLFAEGSYLNSEWEMLTGEKEVGLNREKVNVDNTHAILMAQREEKAVNQKDIAVKSQTYYIDTVSKRTLAEEYFIIKRQQTKALAIAVYSLSREMSRRANN